MHNESIEHTQPVSLSRRQFLRAGTGAALGLGLPSLGWLTGCTSLPASRTPAWNELAASLQGPLLMPGAPDFAAKARPWALQYASTLPQGIAQCLGEADVQTCLQWAQAYPAIDSGVGLSARVRPSAATEDRFDANAFESTAALA